MDTYEVVIALALAVLALVAYTDAVLRISAGIALRKAEDASAKAVSGLEDSVEARLAKLEASADR